jgi:hypothetical protein
MYVIYFFKRCQVVIYEHNLKIVYGEIWLMMEAMIFLTRIFAGMFFLMFNHLFKINPFMRHEFVRENDDNPWNNKDTEDFLRHLKVEFYLFTSQVVNCVLPIFICFLDDFTWIELDSFGPRSFTESQILVLVALIPRLALLSMTFYVALTGQTFNSLPVQKF